MDGMIETAAVLALLPVLLHNFGNSIGLVL